MEILNQTHIVTSPFNEKLFITALKAELSDVIFKELINKEKEAIKLTITMEIIESENE